MGNYVLDILEKGGMQRIEYLIKILDLPHNLHHHQLPQLSISNSLHTGQVTQLCGFLKSKPNSLPEETRQKLQNMRTLLVPLNRKSPKKFMISSSTPQLKILTLSSKKEFVKRTSASEQQQLRQLLTAEQLGDRKPTQVLRQMHQLLENPPL